MDNKNQKIFESGQGRHNACLNNYLGFYDYARYYLESANVLIEIMVKNNSNWDVYIYSAIFLYRHSVELSLKQLIWMSNSLLGKGKTFGKKHLLMDLWKTLKSNAVNLLDSDFPLDEREVKYIESTLQEITKHDPESDGFRYPFDKQMKRPHPDVTHVNVKELYERMNSIHEYLGRLSYMIDYLYNEDSIS